MLKDMMQIISFHAKADNGDEKLVSEKFAIHLIPHFTRSQLKVTSLANRGKVLLCHVIVVSARENVVVKLIAARVTRCCVVKFVLFVRSQFHRFLLVQYLVDFF